MLIDLFGYLGAMLLLAGYYLLSRRKHELTAHILSAVGSVFLAVNTGSLSAYGAMLLNVAWFFIASHSIWRIVRLGNSHQ